MRDKKGQILSLGLAIAVFIILFVILFAFFVFPTVKYTIIGLGFIIGGFVFLVKHEGNFNNKKTMILMAIFGLGLLLIFGSGFFANVLQTEFTSGTYIQTPSFYFYECAPATNPAESTHRTLTTGNSDGWITCPSNTDTCDLWISQTEKTAFLSYSRRIVYQICHNNGANCDNQVFTTSNSFRFYNNVPSVHIPNLLTTDKVWVNYQYKNILLQWKDQPNGAEWYQTYKPFILWKNDMFGGGRTEYTSIEQGCNFKSEDRNNLLNSVTNTIKKISSQTSSSNTNLPFYKTRNFIGSYVPLSTANVNFVTYNGKQGYCLNRQVFAISKVTTNGGSYDIVDSNFNTRLADSVTCCPGENEPTRTCNSNFQWVNKEVPTEGQCSAFKACAGADWAVSASKTLIRYNCVNTKCMPETKKVECTYNSDCGNNQVCDTSDYSCVDVKPGDIISNNSAGNGKSCKWYQDSYSTYTNDYGFLFWKAVFSSPSRTPISGCKTAGWISTIIYGTIISGLIIIVIYRLKPDRRRARRK